MVAAITSRIFRFRSASCLVTGASFRQAEYRTDVRCQARRAHLLGTAVGRGTGSDSIGRAAVGAPRASTPRSHVPESGGVLLLDSRLPKRANARPRAGKTRSERGARGRQHEQPTAVR